MKCDMAVVQHQLVVAVDGGGSKTRALAGVIELPNSATGSPATGSPATGSPATGSPATGSHKLALQNPSTPDVGSVTILSSANAGPGNPRSVGFDTAQANIQTAIDLALDAAHQSLSLPTFADRFPGLKEDRKVAATCLSLAGVGRESDQRRIEQWAYTSKLGSRIIVTTDADPLLAYLNYQPASRLAAPDTSLIHQRLLFSIPASTNAIGLISGTGSFCFGTSAAGKREQCGGWGGLLGDEGGGYWIAMEGLKAATRWADGRGPETRITKIALEFLGLRDATELIGLVYNPQTTRDQLAKVAGIVFALAAEDSIAKNIVEESGRWLAELIQTVARKLEFREQGIKPMLGLAGGNFCNQPILLEATLRELARQNVAVEEAIRIYEPALGGFVLSTQKLLQQLEPTN